MRWRSCLVKLVRLPSEDVAIYRDKARHRDRIALRAITGLIITGLSSRLYFDWYLSPDLIHNGGAYRFAGILCFLVPFVASFHRGAVAYLHAMVGVTFLAGIAVVVKAYVQTPGHGAFVSSSMGIALLLLGALSFGRSLALLIGVMAVLVATVLMPLAGLGATALAPRLMLSGMVGVISLLASFLLDQHWRRAFLAERNLARSHADLQRAHRELGEAHATLKAMQEQLVEAEKTAALGRLVASVAHRINTPVGILVGMASHIADTTERFSHVVADGGVRRQDLTQFVKTMGDAGTIVLESAQRTARLIDAFKRLEAGADEAATAVDIHDLLTRLQPLLAAMMPPGVALVVDAPVGLMIWAAPNLLDTIVQQTVGNAAQHAFPDGRTGTVTVRAGTDQEGGVVLAIADDGRGIRPEHLKHVFDPFYTNGFIGGCEGLGLSIVHNAVVGPLGGRITIDSREDHGTTVILRLPAGARRSPGNPPQGDVAGRVETEMVL